MADYYFQMKDLSVGYNGNSLIRDINIGINKGEIVTLIGPNGSGKSTILKSITRQLKVVGGNVFFDNTSLLKLPYKELASKMAVVLTDRIKTELMTCHDIVATGRYPYTGRLGILTQEDERLVEEAMQAVHAQELGNRDFNAISDGQKQRVLLARAICQDPDVIVLDPPRDGIHPKALPKILSYGVDRIVYVSCKATSLARDLEAFLQAGYRLEKACCVDQFCETVWTEAVAVFVK